MVNAQKYLDKNYPRDITYKKKEEEERRIKLDDSFSTFSRFSAFLYTTEEIKERREIKELQLPDAPDTPTFLNTGKELEGHLDLSDFVNLEILNISYSYLISSLNLGNNSKLRVLMAQNNCLKSMDLANNLQLEEVILFNNAISADLAIFSHLTKLKRLELGFSSEVRKKNDFYGSLKALENCQQLERLCIGGNERIIGGLEYLPTEKLTYFNFYDTDFEGILVPYGCTSNDVEGLKKWKFEWMKTQISTLTTENSQLKSRNLTPWYFLVVISIAFLLMLWNYERKLKKKQKWEAKIKRT